MINDSVREKLATRITSLGVAKTDPKPPSLAPPLKSKGKPKVQKNPNPIQLNPSPKHIATKPVNTSEIVISNTNRTLMEFQSEQTKLPEWRLQLQNAVSRRGKSGSGRSTVSAAPAAAGFSAAVAVDVKSAPEPIALESDNPVINSALKRIEFSRAKFLIEEPVRQSAAPAAKKETENPRKDFPFTIAQRANSEPQTATSVPAAANTAKPTLVRENVPAAKTKYDTSELDPQYIEARVSTSFGKRDLPAAKDAEKTSSDITPVSKTKVGAETAQETAENLEVVEVLDDLTPFSVRFNSGLFDFIIGSFVSLIFLSPFMLLGGSWFTIAGAFGFLATFAVVMFIYLTTTIGIFGKSFGMHLFSLEMIDIGGEEYPTFHQAAVSSSVYLLSMAFGGIGFLTSFFDEDKRAIHDLVSGTIVVKEL
ncbi:MAG: RDD family protein [Pyrinomonadaceae bacterium]